MSTTTAPAIHNRRTSTSNSALSANVRKIGPAPTKSDAKHVHLRDKDPSYDRVHQTSDELRSDIDRSRTRRDNQFVDKTLGVNLNINRWSHSTSSSVSAVENESFRTRANTSLRRMSIGPTLVSGIAPADRGHPGQFLTTIPRSSNRSPHRKLNSASGLLEVGRSQVNSNGSPGTTSPLTPTSMFNTNASEYFGETWQTRKTGTGKNGEPVAMSIHYVRPGPPPPRTDTLAPQRTLQAPNSRPVTREKRPIDTTDSATSTTNAPARGRSHRSPTQKTMLSKALAKANSAVLLDNAQIIEGAIEAYAEACELLQQVLVRSSDLDDRKKLSDIRSTYSNRIAELHDLDDSFSGLLDKALPDDPPFDVTNNTFFTSESVEPDTAGVLETVQIPPRQESLLPEIYGGETYTSESNSRKRIQVPSLAVPMDSHYMPPPLSPRRPTSALSERDTDTPLARKGTVDSDTGAQHAHKDSSESTSWLDTFEDGESSTKSSRLSSVDLGIQLESSLVDEIEAEFDAAMNAAVDAAWDDNMTEENTPRPEKIQDHENSYILPATSFQPSSTGTDLMDGYEDGNSSDEEERLLDEMTRGFVIDDFTFDNKSKSALTHQSDSSTVSGQTWASSLPSTTNTNMTTLSTLAESQEPASEQEMSPRPTPPAKNSPVVSQPTSAPPEAPLPPAPTTIANPPSTVRPTSIDRYAGLGIRERRFSGHSGNQLKIETFARRGSSTSPAPPQHRPGDTSRVPMSAPLEPSHRSRPSSAQPITLVTSMPSTESMRSDLPATPALTQGGSQGSIDDGHIVPPSPGKPGKMMAPPAGMKKNSSSSSLRMRNLSVATTETSESPLTPMSAGYEGRKGVPPLPSTALLTPLAAGFGPQVMQTGGMYLFDDHTAAPASPTSPNGSASAPDPLEPCPESFSLRPFWLMRCLYQTLSHPKGGYITTKLFISRDVWRVKNVKLKSVEDKVSQCDLLTAALQKLARVDTFDADAVLEELQYFETVLDQVRVNLHKKLGNDVGFTGSASLFKGEEAEATTSKSNNTAAKSFASSWRKLRSKSSTPAIGNSTIPKDMTSGLSMSSVPMTSATSMPSSRSQPNRKNSSPPTPRELANIQPLHATYMSSLARLFDAAQVLDDIARQVEDPGLKCSNKTQVGLELGVKNAAEFFAFFVIRFVMADLSIMIDKFLKRGTEWVLA